jgi:hypothetical protein
MHLVRPPEPEAGVPQNFVIREPSDKLDYLV